MRSSTLLEGRAVVQSLLWIIDGVGVEDQRANDLIREYLRVNYGPGTPYDYVFLLDLAASWIGDPNFEAVLTRPTVIVRAILHNVDNAVWFALQAGFYSTKEGLRPENMFTRFLFGIKALREGSDSEGPPYAVLEAAETSEDARASGLIPTMEALGSSLLLVEETQKRLDKIWQQQMSAHFSTVFSVLSAELQRRQAGGLRFGSGAPADGNSLSTLSDETYQALFTAYNPGKWVKEWFDFRNSSLFSPSTSRVTLQHLRKQFGLAEVAVNCDCGYLLSQPVPKWRPGTVKISCPGCGRQHFIRPEDLTYIHLPDDD